MASKAKVRKKVVKSGDERKPDALTTLVAASNGQPPKYAPVPERGTNPGIYRLEYNNDGQEFTETFDYSANAVARVQELKRAGIFAETFTDDPAVKADAIIVP